MRSTVFSFLISAIAALLLAACAEDGPNAGGTAGDSGSVGETQDASLADAEHSAEGVVNSVDAEGETVNISHEPVESIGWPSMRMDFQLADPDLATQLAPGQRVEFRFTAREGSATVTEITPLDDDDQ